MANGSREGLACANTVSVGGFVCLAEMSIVVKPEGSSHQTAPLSGWQWVWCGHTPWVQCSLCAPSRQRHCSMFDGTMRCDFSVIGSLALPDRIVRALFAVPPMRDGLTANGDSRLRFGWRWKGRDYKFYPFMIRWRMLGKAHVRGIWGNASAVYSFLMYSFLMWCHNLPSL